MKIEIANPIYDTVFKYLMEDDRIAKILLSALLKSGLSLSKIAEITKVDGSELKNVLGRDNV